MEDSDQTADARADLNLRCTHIPTVPYAGYQLNAFMIFPATLVPSRVPVIPDCDPYLSKLVNLFIAQTAPSFIFSL